MRSVRTINDTPYIPKQRDIIIINFDPQAGHEQMGRRPALVISQTAYNQTTGFAVVCPISSTDRANPFYVGLPNNLNTYGKVLSEQFRSLDYKARRAEFAEQCPLDTFNLVMAKIKPILF